MSATPRLKITYATLRADNEELHALYEAGLEKARAGSARTTATSSTARSATATGTFEVRSPIDSDDPRRDVREGHPPGRPQDAIAAARPRAAGVVPPRLGEAARDPQGAPRSSSPSARWSTAA